MAEHIDRTAVVVQLRGNSFRRPQAAPMPNGFGAPRRYRQLLLSFADEGASTRWLTHDEITVAALGALTNPAAEQIAGRLDPWTIEKEDVLNYHTTLTGRVTRTSSRSYPEW